MKRFIPALAPATLAILFSVRAWALSLMLPTPQITFPKDFSSQKAAAIEAVLSDKKYHYVNGIYSHWPPNWYTTLVYEGDTKSLNTFLNSLRGVEAVHVRVTLSRDLSKETGSALTAGSWWVIYSHVTPDVITVRINLSNKGLNLDDLEFMLSRPSAAKADHERLESPRKGRHTGYEVE
jgi:hypothetical protein